MCSCENADWHHFVVKVEIQCVNSLDPSCGHGPVASRLLKNGFPKAHWLLDLFFFWGKEHFSSYPIASMGPLYLPSFSIKIYQMQVDHGWYGCLVK